MIKILLSIFNNKVLLLKQSTSKINLKVAAIFKLAEFFVGLLFILVMLFIIFDIGCSVLIYSSQEYWRIPKYIITATTQVQLTDIKFIGKPNEYFK